MGLTIVGVTSEKKYRYGYTQLHIVRWIACRSKGYSKPFGSLFMEDQKNNLWEEYPDFWQLLHFSDSEGVLIRDDFLFKVDYKESLQLGSSTKLLEELELVKDELARNPEDYRNIKTDSFFALYDLVKDEVENGRGILYFC